MSEPGPTFMISSALIAMALWSSLAVSSEPLSDPTRPPAAIDVSATLTEEVRDIALDLRAIFFADGRRVAIINDHRVREQDMIGSARVLEIGPAHVRLRRQGRDFDLKLIRRDIKREPGSNRERIDVLPAATASGASERRNAPPPPPAPGGRPE
ncbi:MAG TPA: hypothetical protein ENI85_07530 [Deltaproteobacteria bacterium]|nr:hypothetical protein [Deltaproteobacteria bacterium]